MQKPIRQYGTKQPTSYTCVKWSPHAPGLLAIGTAANFGVVGKGGVQVKAIDGISIKNIAASEEVVISCLYSKLFSMFPGLN